MSNVELMREHGVEQLCIVIKSLFCLVNIDEKMGEPQTTALVDIGRQILPFLGTGGHNRLLLLFVRFLDNTLC